MTPFRTDRLLPAAPHAVFAALRDPQRLARWWGPAGFTNTFEVFEFQPGGRWQFVMHGPDGTNYPNVSTFEAIETDASVRIRHESAPHFTLTITLAAEGGGTRVGWEQVFDDDGVAEQLRAIVEPANEQNLDRLAAQVQA